MIKQKFIYIKVQCNDCICLNCKYFNYYISGVAECTLFMHPLNLIYIPARNIWTFLRERTYKRLDICKKSQVEETAILNILNNDFSGIYLRLLISFEETQYIALKNPKKYDCSMCNFSRGTTCKIFNKSSKYRCDECIEAENI